MWAEFTPTIDWTKYVQIKQELSVFFLEPISRAQLLFTSQSQWVSPTFVDWFQNELDLQNKNELIAHKRKWMAPENNYVRFISLLSEGSRFYIITVYPSQSGQMKGTITFTRLKTYLFYGVINCEMFWFDHPNKILQFSSIWGQ